MMGNIPQNVSTKKYLRRLQNAITDNENLIHIKIANEDK